LPALACEPTFADVYVGSETFHSMAGTTPSDRRAIVIESQREAATNRDMPIFAGRTSISASGPEGETDGHSARSARR
jgi:hypothetical protein